MIKNIFLPERIGNYYLFAKRIVGINIGKAYINATQIRLNGTSIVIEKVIEQPLEPGNTNDYHERVQNALQAIFDHLDTFDELVTVLSSSLAIYKELKLPFVSHHKIKMVLNFEVEPLLPFPAQTAVIDFIITKQVAEEKSSEILVTAVQKQHIAQHLQLFEALDLQPDIITLDLFSLYGLYKQTPYYAQLQGSIVIIDLGFHSTRIAYIHNGQLRSIRVLAKGTYSIAKAASEHLDITPNQAMENIIRFGLEKIDSPEYTKAVTDALALFWNNVRFTLDSFITQVFEGDSINKLILLGSGAEIKGLSTFVSDLLDIETELFQVKYIFQDKSISVKNNQTITNTAIISLSAALPSTITAIFNLRKDEFSIPTQRLLLKQAIVGIVLVLIILGSIFAYTTWQINKLGSELKDSELQTVEQLKTQFKQIPLDEEDLEDVTKIAQQAVKKEEETWFAFSAPARMSFLKYLLELTNRIDKESIGFIINKINIVPGLMTLDAQVKDYEALKIFERELRKSPLFSTVEPQDDPVFTMKITLEQNGEGT